MVQVTQPPKSDLAKLESKVAETLAHINSTYGSLHFQPVHYHQHYLQREEYYALISIADVALITSTRDGMNTTSHEFVVCQQENHGCLILSEFCGTAGSLSAAIQINPWDLEVAH